MVDPLNSMLHRHWPTQLRERNLDVLLQFYATETGSGLTWEGEQPVALASTEHTIRWLEQRGDEPIRQRYRRLLDLFPEILSAELRIDRVDWRIPCPLVHRATILGA